MADTELMSVDPDYEKYNEEQASFANDTLTSDEPTVSEAQPQTLPLSSQPTGEIPVTLVTPGTAPAAAAAPITDADPVGVTPAPIPWWYDADDPWDDLFIDKKKMPGIWEVINGETVRDIDKKKAKATDAAKLTDLGNSPAKFSAIGRIYTRRDWVELQERIPKILPDHGKEKRAVSIYHPAIALLGVLEVYITRATSPLVKNGIMEMTIEFTEIAKEAPTVSEINKEDVDKSNAAEVLLTAANAAQLEPQFSVDRSLWRDPSQKKKSTGSVPLPLGPNDFARIKGESPSTLVNGSTVKGTRGAADGVDNKGRPLYQGQLPRS